MSNYIYYQCLVNVCGPGGSLWAWYSPTCRILALPQVDMPALALSQAPQCFTGSACPLRDFTFMYMHVCVAYKVYTLIDAYLKSSLQ